jgi:DNA-binding response OmpR family regulator
MASVLLIEGDKLLASATIDFLKFRGHEVSWHVNAQAAIDGADSQRPDIVVLDFVLAGRSGLEFLYEFRSYSDWQKMPAIVLSNVAAADLGSALANFKQLGISAYHYKPTTTLSQLAQTIDQVLQPVTV